MKIKINLFVYPLAVIAMSLFVFIGCSDGDTEPKYDLTLEVSPEGSGEVTGAGEYHKREHVNISATSEEGWEFMNWAGNTDYVDDPNKAITRVVMPAQNIALRAYFQEEIVYPIYGDGVTDIDGNEYVTVIIGKQEWMAENLRVSRYNNGDAIPTGLSNTDWWTTTQGGYAIYDNEENLLTGYGKLYNWYAVADPRGLCPEGWHVPTDDDWTEMLNYVIGQGYPNVDNNPNGTGSALRSCRQIDSPLGGDCDTSEHPRWDQWHNNQGFDAFGFSGLPGGTRYHQGGYYALGNYAFWWSSEESSSEEAWQWNCFLLNSNVRRNSSDKSDGYSIRCVRH